MTNIHPQAIVDPKAELARDVEVGPFAIIGSGVTIGAGSVITKNVSKGSLALTRSNQKEKKNYKRK